MPRDSERQQLAEDEALALRLQNMFLVGSPEDIQDGPAPCWRDPNVPTCSICSTADMQAFRGVCRHCEDILGMSKREYLARDTNPESGSSATNSQAGPRAEGTAEEVVWSTIQQYIRTQTGPKPLVKCAICSEELIIPGLQEPNGEREAHRVLQCGHVVGADCIAEWIRIRLSEFSMNSRPNCPYCRKEITDNYTPRERPPYPSLSINPRR
ncbi:hypothetical protein OQA88_11529, partial [Cercophora sp. LCS_1]